MTRFPPPQTSAVPSPSSIFMPPTSSTSSTGPERWPAAAAATTAEPTPLPPPNRPPGGEEQQQQQGQEEDSAGHDGDGDTFPLPKLRLHIQDATHPGASRFLAAVDAPAVFARSVQTVLRLLYISPHRHNAHDNSADADADPTAAAEQQHHLDTTATTTTRRSRRPARPHYTPPPTRSVTLILEDMPGVAYTKGTELDDDHKEIHLSMGYVKGIRRAVAAPPTPSTNTTNTTTTTTTTTTGHGGDPAGAHEIEGVLVHELVHCFQYNGRGACPGGLVEGVADWVRLSAELGPPHWRRGAVPDRWDQGYERTAYFLDWLEGRFGMGTVRRINEALRVCPLTPFTFFKIPFPGDDS